MRRTALLGASLVAASGLGIASAAAPSGNTRGTYHHTGPGVRNPHKGCPSRYMPHQGQREIARRRRQAAKPAQ